MKILALIIALFFTVNSIAVAPYGFRGQNQTAVQYSNVLQFPNSQVTKLSGINSLVETGNKNILLNPDFENNTFNSSWTATTVTPAVETTTVISGKKSVIMTPSAQTFTFVQDSTLYASNFQGSTQLLAMVWIRTNQNGIKVCSRNDGVTSTTNCATVAPQSPSVWQLIKVPFISSSTSNGISIAASSAITGNVYIDDAFVGAVDLKTDVDQSRIAGESFFAGTASCTPSTTSTTIGVLTAAAACPGPTIVNSSMGTWATTDSDLIRQTVTNLPAGRYKATFYFGNFTSVGVNTLFAINDGTTTCEPVFGAPFSTGTTGQVVSCTFNYASSGTRVFELYAAVQAAATLTVQNSVATPRASTKFILEYFGSGQIYSASNANYSRTAYTPTFTGFGTVSAVDCYHARDGQFLEIDCKWTSGTATAVEARVSLPNSLVSAASSGIRNVGSMGVNASTLTFIPLIEPATGYLTFSNQVGTGSGAFTKLNGTGMGATNSFNARVPISGWENSNIIVGSFAEVPTTRGSNGVDIQEVYFGSGANCTTACSTGTCAICRQVGNKITSVTFSSTATYLVNGIDGTKCTCSGTGLMGGNYGSIVQVLASSTSTYSYIQSGSGAAGGNAANAHLRCSCLP